MPLLRALLHMQKSLTLGKRPAARQARPRDLLQFPNVQRQNIHAMLMPYQQVLAIWTEHDAE